ncbi:pyridoxal-phosphate dependent enzyme, partial [Stenotrophomonas geniculata]
SNRYAIERAQTDGLTFIPPYDDELVIAGQGTIAMELVQQWRKMEYVFVAVGGGGLISGVASIFGGSCTACQSRGSRARRSSLFKNRA